MVINCPYSFADKPQSVIYLDQEKVNMFMTVGDDWSYKLSKFSPELKLSLGEFCFKGRPELPNLLRIILHEVGHLIEYHQLKFSWKGEFVANDLNRDFVLISWDERKGWKERESLFVKVYRLKSTEDLESFVDWFKKESSFLSIYAATGMNEDFAETFVYYFLIKHFDYSLDLWIQERLAVENVQYPNRKRQQKLDFVASVTESYLQAP